MFLDFLVWGCQLSLQTPGAVLIQCWQTAPISVTVLNRFAALENVCLTLSLSPFSFVKMQEMPGTIFAQASKMISVFGLKLFWRKKWGKTYLVLLEVKTGGWENLFASMEKHACFWRINKDGWSYLGPATSVKLIWWLGNSFLHANTRSPSQDPSPGCSWTTTIRKLKCLSLAKFPHTESI